MQPFARFFFLGCDVENCCELHVNETKLHIGRIQQLKLQVHSVQFLRENSPHLSGRETFGSLVFILLYYSSVGDVYCLPFSLCEVLFSFRL